MSVMLEPVRFSVEQIAHLYDLPAHIMTYDLSPGYWERQLRREVSRRSLRARVRLFVERWR